MIHRIHVRECKEQENAPCVYVGRGPAPAGCEHAYLGNPLPVEQKGRWTTFTEEACAVVLWEAPHLEGVIKLARRRGGFLQGQAAGLYLYYLRAVCQFDTAERQMILSLAQRLAAGEELRLVCWCTADQPCHANSIAQAVTGYAKGLKALKVEAA